MDERSIARFWGQVDRRGADECWHWTGTSKPNGYGIAYLNGHGSMNAHRAAYIIANGTIEAGLEVCHSCDVRSCCNPSHLWAGTHTENVRDMSAKGRNLSAITREGIHLMRLLYASGMWGGVQLAKRFGLSPNATYNHLRKSAAAHVATIVRDDDGFYAIRDGAIVGTGRTAAEALAASE